MKRILVPVDFSPTSKKAFRFAVDIASRSGAAILLYHLYTPGTKAMLGSKENILEYNKRAEESNLKRLQRLKKSVLADTTEIPVSTIIGRAPIINNILGFAEHNHIDMIVMGTQGASGLKKVTVGSVAAKIMAKSGIPVLLVPEKFEWKSPENIVFISSFHKADKSAWPVVLEITKLYEALLTLVNISDSEDSLTYTDKNNFEMYAYGLQREFNDIRIQFKQLKTNSIIKTMENLPEEIPYDLLIMVRRKLGFLNRLFQGSFTKKIAYITTLPLLIAPEE
jgi:nucleotide-binding universal stress UspA family protein